MKQIALLFLLIFACSFATFAQSNSKAEAAIRKVMDEQAAAWNRADLEGFMAGYWNSPDLMFVSGDKITRGWQQTLDNYKKTYGGTSEKMGFLTFSDVEIKVLSKDSAFVVGSWHLKRKDDAPQGKYTLLFRKIKKDWRIVIDHSS